MKAKKWIERANARRDPIDKFRDLWVAFNNQYAAYSGNQREKIERYIDDRVSEEIALGILDDQSDQIEFLLSRPVIDMRSNGRNTQHLINAFRSSKDAVEKLKSILLIAYQVRCNLVHGQKSPDRNRDRNLCECSGAVLSTVLNSTS